MANLAVELNKRINAFLSNDADLSTFSKLSMANVLKPFIDGGVALVERQTRSESEARNFDGTDYEYKNFNQISNHTKSLPVMKWDHRIFTLDEQEKGITSMGLKIEQWIMNKREQALQSSAKEYFNVAKDTITYNTAIQNQNGGFNPTLTAKTAHINTNTINTTGTPEEIVESLLDNILSEKEKAANYVSDFDRGISESNLRIFIDYSFKAPLMKYFRKTNEQVSVETMKNGIESVITMIDGTVLYFIKTVDFISGAAFAIIAKDSIYVQSPKETVRTEIKGPGDIVVWYGSQEFSMNQTPDRIFITNKTVIKK